MKLEELKFIDLFAGIGGFRQALEAYGAECVFSSEIDKYAQDTYEMNYHEKPEGDIMTIKNEDVPEHNILCAGFPCQPFSISGNQKGFEDERGTLFFEIYRIAKYHEPEILLLENVANLKRHNDSETIKIMIEKLREIGYIVNVEELNASDYNVPQSRKRLYFVCFHEKKCKVKDFKYPRPIPCTKYLKDVLQGDDETVECRIIRDDIVLKDIEVIECQPKPIRIGTINKGGQGDRIYSPLGHAITLSAQGGGAGAKTGAYYINNHVRKLSPRECARVQGFPENFKICTSRSQAYKQFGNSVAVPVLKAILENVEYYIKDIEKYN